MRKRVLGLLLSTLPYIQASAGAEPWVDCDYKIPAQTKTVEPSLLLTWSEHAAMQAFHFDSSSISQQMQKLKTCFTDQGWTGFESAMEKSGNLEAISSQKLSVRSQLDGKSQLIASKDNQWKITVPLQVIYQNDKEKVTQILEVNLTLRRKVSGDLGIVQMIAAPKTATASDSDSLDKESSPLESNKSTPSSTTP